MISLLFYVIESLQLIDANNNYYDLKTSLKYNQLKLTDVEKYLEIQAANGNVEKYNLYDEGTKIYKSKKI